MSQDWLQFLRLLVSGVSLGSIAALSGLGLVVTYRATGVFNFGHGAIATFVAYMYWQMTVAWHMPVLLAALIAIFIISPLIGFLLERFIFRALERRGAGTSEKLVAALGVFVLFAGICVGAWGFLGKNLPHLWRGRVDKKWLPKGVTVNHDQLLAVLVVLGVSALLYVLFNHTRLGLQIRAVVDRRELAELASINANRVSSVAWMLGCTLAGLAGVLFGTYGLVSLTPYGFTLIVIETFGVAMIARLVSLPLAVLGGIALYTLRSELGHQLFNLKAPWDALQVNLGVIALFAFVLIYRNLDEVGSTASTGRGLVAGALGRSNDEGRRGLLRIGALGGLALLLPLILQGDNLKTAQVAVATFVVFLSIVAITGFSGHISLGQAGFAGLGGWLTAKFAEGRLLPNLRVPRLPVIVAMVVAALITAAVGFLVGYPALRRKGLFLGLTTLAVGLILHKFVFDNVSAGAAHPVRPSLFGASLAGDRAFLWFELVVAAVALFLTRNLRSGRLGRILGAMRDSETATQAVGISLRRYKLFIFSTSAFIAALGGALLTQQTQGTFEPESFNGLISLFWFTAVVVGGLSYLSGAAIATTIYVVLDKVLPGQGTAIGLIGLGALLIGYYPGGLAALGNRFFGGSWVPRGLHTRYLAAKERQFVEALEPEPPDEPAPPGPALEPTDFARTVLEEVRP
jgi:branched-chain amino acid transport system permease protein